MTAGNPQIAVIGCGYWGMNHVRTLSELGMLAAVCDADAQRASSAALAHGSRPLDLDAVLGDEAIDAAVLALPGDQHPAVAEALIRAGKHVLAEKPMALSAAAATRLASVGRKHGRIVMTGHILRYHNAFRAALRLAADGEIGALRHIQSHRLAFGKFHDRFDALWDLAPHDVSMVLTIAGRAPLRVSGETVAFAGEAADMAHVHMDFGGGLGAHIHVSRHSPYRERRFVVTGSEGMILWDDFADWPQKVSVFRHRVWQTQGANQFSLSEPEYLSVEPNMALTDELLHFAECIAGGTTPQTDGDHAVEVLTVLERASQRS